MHEVPRRNTLIVVTILAVAFFGAGGLGLALAAALAPGSQVASAISFLLFPFAMISGFNAWLGLAVLILAPQLIARLLRRGPSRGPTDARREVIPPGSWAFLPISSAVALAGGIVVGFFSVTHEVWFVALVYWMVGTAYGAILWFLARIGYLPFPDSGH
jgi:hypothetical protein